MRIDGKTSYALEGNINYAGAVISWLVQDLQLLKEPKEAERHAWAASLADRTVLVPAFSGLGAPYWEPDARAMFYGMSRSTGQSELICAALESIAFQVADVTKAMRQDCGMELAELRVDGGPARNQYLMQIQSEAAGVKIAVASQEELSAIGRLIWLALQRVFMIRKLYFRICVTRYMNQERRCMRNGKKP